MISLLKKCTALMCTGFKFRKIIPSCNMYIDEMCMIELINLYTTHIIYTVKPYDLYIFSSFTHVVKEV